VSLEFATSN